MFSTLWACLELGLTLWAYVSPTLTPVWAKDYGNPSFRVSIISLQSVLPLRSIRVFAHLQSVFLPPFNPCFCSSQPVFLPPFYPPSIIIFSVLFVICTKVCENTLQRWYRRNFTGGGLCNYMFTKFSCFPSQVN